MGDKNEGKDSKTEAAIDIALAIGKTIIEILTERRKRWIILNVKKWNQILKKNEDWSSKLKTLLTILDVIMIIIKTFTDKRK